MARAPRNYLAEYNALQASRRGPLLEPVSNREKYLRRMAGQQRKAQRAGEEFTPQRARGHKPQEHRTPARRVAHERYAREAFYARREARQDKWFKSVSQRLSGPTMIRQERKWASIDPDHRQRIIEARAFALRHRGQYTWDWYMEEFDLDTDDVELFGYG